MPLSTKIILIVLAAAVVLGYAIWRFKTRDKRREKRRRQQMKEKINALSKSAMELTPQQFMELRTESFGFRGKYRFSEELNFSGVYILYNVQKNKYYVGQGRKIADRVNMHFTGKGNGDVYADYKYGDDFTIKLIDLNESGYSSLNDLERDTIEFYDACATGYNKTKGNKTE